ncbi:MAG: AtpZ/AtpI family protein [bacterium]|nr:AtpZ/AtpI family protein [bacterium]
MTLLKEDSSIASTSMGMENIPVAHFSDNNPLTEETPDAKIKQPEDIYSISTGGEMEKVAFKKNLVKKGHGDYSVYLNLGFYLITPVLLGVVVGGFLDNHFHTKHVFFYILLSLGTLACFYNLVKLFKQEDASHKH